MRTEAPEGETSHPVQLTPLQHDAVVGEMNRILADPAFNGSKRCVILFRHLVNNALKGEQSEFKERSLGIEVFGRDPSYDSQADPIVRMTANEIRKRLAQCYFEEKDSHHFVKIRLVRGGYTPEFDFGNAHPSDAGESVTPEISPDPSIVAATSGIPEVGIARRLSPSFVERKWLSWITIIILVSAAAAALYHHNLLRPRQDRFWEPLIHSEQPLMMVMADDPSLVGTNGEDRAQMTADKVPSGENTLSSGHLDSIPTTQFVNASTANRIAWWLGLHGRKVVLHQASKVTLQLLRQGPTVMIGGFDNPWSLILLSHLRYSIHVDPSTHEKWIEDAQNTLKRDWRVKAGLHFEESFVDYAVITRSRDSETENWIAGITSLGPHASHAASDLIADDSYDKLLPSEIDAKKNFQIVVRTSVLHGTAGPPQIVAVYSW